MRYTNTRLTAHGFSQNYAAATDFCNWPKETGQQAPVYRLALKVRPFAKEHACRELFRSGGSHEIPMKGSL